MSCLRVALGALVSFAVVSLCLPTATAQPAPTAAPKGPPESSPPGETESMVAEAHRVDHLVAEEPEQAERELGALRDMVEMAVNPETWDTCGGEGCARTFSTGAARMLVVRHRPQVHAEVRRLLEAIGRLVADAEAGRAPPTVLDWRGRRPGVERVEKALEKTLSCDFRQVPLDQVAAWLARKTGVPIKLDRMALEDVGIEADMPLTFRASEISFRSVLRLMLRTCDLTYEIRDGAFRITTPEVAEKRCMARLYPVRDLVAGCDSVGCGDRKVTSPGLEALADLVQTVAHPTRREWDAIKPVALRKARLLVLYHTQDAHQGTADLLTALRQLARESVGGNVPEPRMVGRGHQSKAVEAIHIALVTRFSFELDEMPLSVVAETIRRKAGINVVLDLRALEDVGLGPDIPITKRLKDINLRSSLRLLLRELDLTYIIQDEVLLITTPESAESRLLVGVYPVRDLIESRDPDGKIRHDFEELEQLIHFALGPTTWSSEGGPGSHGAAPFEDVHALVVRQTEEGHREVRDLLAALRKAARLAPQDPAEHPYLLLSGEDERPASKAIWAALDKRVSFDFCKKPLANVVAHFRKQFGIEIQIDRRALEDVGIGTDVPVTKRLKAVTFRSALRHLLRDLDLTCVIQDEVLLITTPETAESRIEAAVYPIGDLAAEPSLRGDDPHGLEALIDLITAAVRPTAWDDVGGPGSVFGITAGQAPVLVVDQTRDVHEEVASLLAVVRQLVSDSAAGKPPVCVIVEWAGEPEATGAIRKALARKATKATFDFVECPLADVLAGIEDWAGINVLVDRRALEDVGIGTDVPVTGKCKDMPLREFLRSILRDVDLTWIIQDEVLLITTPEVAESRLLTGVYPARDLAEVRGPDSPVRYDYDGLAKVIQSAVWPATWDELGGPGSIGTAPFEGVHALVISQTEEGHEAVRAVLARLREIKRLAAADPALAAERPYFLLDPDDESPQSRAIREALKKKVSLDFVNAPLGDAIDFLRRALQVEVQADRRALEGLDIGMDSRMTFHVKDMRAAGALRLMLRSLGLAFGIEDGVLLITSPSKVQRAGPVALFPVGDLVPAADTPGADRKSLAGLAVLVQATVAPGSWRADQGEGEIIYVGLGGIRGLVVSGQPERVLDQIAGLLAELRRQSPGGTLTLMAPRRLVEDTRPEAPPPSALQEYGIRGGGMF